MAGPQNSLAPQNNWQALGAGGLYGAYVSGGGGIPVARDNLDARRIGVGQVPQAQYPDGFLGTIQSRREDRMLDSLKSRQTQRSYQRGVHKGERIDPSDYFFPKGLEPDRGLRNQARGVKTGPQFDLAPHPHLVNDGKADVQANGPAEIDPRRVMQLRGLRPSWT